MGRLALVATVLAWTVYFIFWLYREFIDGGAVSTRSKVEALLYLAMVTLLTASAMAYLVCRLGFFYRNRDHRRVPRAALDEFFARSIPTMTVIIPSYREEHRVVRATLLSAALQEYPHLRVTLLIDDPPDPTKPHDIALLDAARRLPGEIQELLDEPSRYFEGALERFESSIGTQGEPALQADDMVRLAGHFDHAVGWLNALADDTPIVDHADAFFVDHVVRELAADFSLTGAALRTAAAEGVVLPASRLLEFYRRLAWTFRATVTSFERKQYANLSHESNKAMNLNSYIGLMGAAYRDVITVSGRVLVPTSSVAADLEVPDPDYILTLDADSVLLPEYCLRLVYLLEQSEHARVAVAQTPYSSYPGAATRLERIAGATTDLQHICHQGMTHYDATFWVGANAVLRKKALDEVRTTTYVGNWEIHRYIQDRTVIEDTESTIDLGTHGWQLLNYPERLSYSATPPDFGALCIQRRRWANGGLLILPKLHRQSKTRRRQGERTRFGEWFLRVNYMASICWSSLALLLLLLYPFNNALLLPVLPLVALPYFVAMASDLKYCGYKYSDVLRIYGFNLVLLPVNLSGVGNSIVQGMVGDKSVFGRTPKVRDRTIPNLLFIVAPYLLVLLCAFTLWRDVLGSRWDNAVYATVNVVLMSYAIVAYIGLRHSFSDAVVQVKARLLKPEKPSRQSVSKPAERVANPPSVDWASILHFGSVDAIVRPRNVVPADVIMDTDGEVLDLYGTRRMEASLEWHATSVHPEVGFSTVFQPVWDLERADVVGLEALTRFEDGVAPDSWLADRAARGTGIELETLLARAALANVDRTRSDVWIALNVSIEFIRAGTALARTVESSPQPIVLEVECRDLRSETARRGLLSMMPAGARLALSGATSRPEDLSLVRDLRPTFVKMHRSLLHPESGQGPNRTGITALMSAADRVGGSIVAQGVESASDLELLRELAVPLGQGFFLGRPRQLTSVTTLPSAAWASTTEDPPATPSDAPST